MWSIAFVTCLEKLPLKCLNLRCIFTFCEGKNIEYSHTLLVLQGFLNYSRSRVSVSTFVLPRREAIISVSLCSENQIFAWWEWKEYSTKTFRKRDFAQSAKLEIWSQRPSHSLQQCFGRGGDMSVGGWRLLGKVDDWHSLAGNAGVTSRE